MTSEPLTDIEVANLSEAQMARALEAFAKLLEKTGIGDLPPVNPNHPVLIAVRWFKLRSANRGKGIE